jgi:hypothetical protein
MGEGMRLPNFEIRLQFDLFGQKSTKEERILSYCSRSLLQHNYLVPKR